MIDSRGTSGVTFVEYQGARECSGFNQGFPLCRFPLLQLHTFVIIMSLVAPIDRLFHHHIYLKVSSRPKKYGVDVW